MADLTGLGEVGKSLVEAVRSATGVLYEPLRIKRKLIAEAKGEVEAKKILALGDLENKAIVERAANRLFEKAVQQQVNIEDIIDKAIPLLNENANPDMLEKDWLNRFVDNAEKVSSSDAQELWAKILAGEANTPGRYSVRTLNILSSMSKADAQLLQRVAQLTLNLRNDTFTPIVPDTGKGLVADLGLRFVDFKHLDEVGIVTFNLASDFNVPSSQPPHRVMLLAEDGRIGFAVPKEGQGRSGTFDFRLGKVLLTQSGTELMRLIDSVDRSALIDMLSKPSNPLGWVLEVTSITTPSN